MVEGSSPHWWNALLVSMPCGRGHDRRSELRLFVPSGVCVAESAMAPPSPIPNLVVPHGSAGEYCTGNRVGGEAAAHTPQLRCLIYFLQGRRSLTTAGWSSGSSLGS